MGVSGWNCPASDITLAISVNGQGRQKSKVAILQAKKYLSILWNGLRERVCILDFSPLCATSLPLGGSRVLERIGRGFGSQADTLFRLADEELTGIEFDVRISGAYDGVVGVELGPVRVGAIENEFIGGRIAIYYPPTVPISRAPV
jgi:hypothetical protein